MTLPHQLLGQVGHNSLGAAIAMRGNALVQRGHLGNSHGLILPLEVAQMPAADWRWSSSTKVVPDGAAGGEVVFAPQMPVGKGVVRWPKFEPRGMALQREPLPIRFAPEFLYRSQQVLRECLTARKATASVRVALSGSFTPCIQFLERFDGALPSSEFLLPTQFLEAHFVRLRIAALANQIEDVTVQREAVRGRQTAQPLDVEFASALFVGFPILSRRIDHESIIPVAVQVSPPLHGQPRLAPGLKAARHVGHAKTRALQETRGDGGSRPALALCDHRFAAVELAERFQERAEKAVLGLRNVASAELAGGPNVDQRHLAGFDAAPKFGGIGGRIRFGPQADGAHCVSVEVA